MKTKSLPSFSLCDKYDLLVRSARILANSNINSIDDLLSKSWIEISYLPQMDKRVLDDIKACLDHHGLFLKSAFHSTLSRLNDMSLSDLVLSLLVFQPNDLNNDCGLISFTVRLSGVYIGFIHYIGEESTEKGKPWFYSFQYMDHYEPSLEQILYYIVQKFSLLPDQSLPTEY